MVPARVGCRFHRHPGYTITELLVIVAVLGIIGSVVLNGIGSREWQRRRVNAVAVELNGWMEAVRRAALKGTGCEITLIINTPIRSGGEIARASPVSTAADAVPNTCLSQQPLPDRPLPTRCTWQSWVSAANQRAALSDSRP